MELLLIIIQEILIQQGNKKKNTENLQNHSAAGREQNR